MDWIDSRLRWSRLLQQTIATCSEKDGETMDVKVIVICWASVTGGESRMARGSAAGRERDRQTDIFWKCGAGFKPIFKKC